MNREGCPLGYARDELFLIGRNRSEVLPCSFPYIAYAVICGFFTLTYIVVATIRTKALIARSAQRASKGKPAKMTRRERFLYTYTIARTWFHAVLIAFVTIIPLSVSLKYSNIMTSFAGLLGRFGPGAKERGKTDAVQAFITTLICVAWIQKLIRLGKKIGINFNELSESAADKSLKRVDSVHKLIFVIIGVMGTCSFIISIVLVHVYTELRIFLKLVFILYGLGLPLAGIAVIYQYYRVERTIITNEAHLNGVRVQDEQEENVLQAMHRRFRRQRFLLIVIVVPGVILYLLYGFEVIPIDWSTVVVLNGIDFLVTVTHVFVFLVSKRKKTSTSSSKAVNEEKGAPITNGTQET